MRKAKEKHISKNNKNLENMYFLQFFLCFSQFLRVRGFCFDPFTGSKCEEPAKTNQVHSPRTAPPKLVPHKKFAGQAKLAGLFGPLNGLIGGLGPFKRCLGGSHPSPPKKLPEINRKLPEKYIQALKKNSLKLFPSTRKLQINQSGGASGRVWGGS